MVIREFIENDIAPANALTNHYIVNTVVHFAAAPATDAEFGAMWRGGRVKFPWLTIDVDGTFGGYAKGATWRTRDAYARTVETGIYISQHAQGRGVGKFLYQALLDRLRDAGFRVAIGGVTLPNPASVRLHETLGFTHAATFHSVGFKFNQWHDVGFWELDLSRPSPAPKPAH